MALDFIWMTVITHDKILPIHAKLLSSLRPTERVVKRLRKSSIPVVAI